MSARRWPTPTTKAGIRLTLSAAAEAYEHAVLALREEDFQAFGKHVSLAGRADDSLPPGRPGKGTPARNRYLRARRAVKRAVAELAARLRPCTRPHDRGEP